jgi:hypothetical protein
MSSVAIQSFGVRPGTIRWASSTRSDRSNALGVPSRPYEHRGGDERVGSEPWMDAHIARPTGSSV